MSGPSAARILGLCCRGHPRTQGELLAMAQRAPLQAAVFGSDAAAFSPSTMGDGPGEPSSARACANPVVYGTGTPSDGTSTKHCWFVAAAGAQRCASTLSASPQGDAPPRVRKVSVAQVSAGNESRVRASATVATSRPVWRTRVAALATNSPFDFAITPEGR